MREADKRQVKMLIGVVGMVPLVAALLMILFPDLGPVAAWKRISIAAFIGFAYCFGLTKWVFPNG